MLFAVEGTATEVATTATSSASARDSLEPAASSRACLGWSPLIRHRDLSQTHAVALVRRGVLIPARWAQDQARHGLLTFPAPFSAETALIQYQQRRGRPLARTPRTRSSHRTRAPRISPIPGQPKARTGLDPDAPARARICDLRHRFAASVAASRACDGCWDCGLRSPCLHNRRADVRQQTHSPNHSER